MPRQVAEDVEADPPGRGQQTGHRGRFERSGWEGGLAFQKGPHSGTLQPPATAADPRRATAGVLGPLHGAALAVGSGQGGRCGRLASSPRRS